MIYDHEEGLRSRLNHSRYGSMLWFKANSRHIQNQMQLYRDVHELTNRSETYIKRLEGNNKDEYLFYKRTKPRYTYITKRVVSRNNGYILNIKKSRVRKDAFCIALAYHLKYIPKFPVKYKTVAKFNDNVILRRHIDTNNYVLEIRTSYTMARIDLNRVFAVEEVMKTAMRYRQLNYYKSKPEALDIVLKKVISGLLKKNR